MKINDEVTKRKHIYYCFSIRQLANVYSIFGMGDCQGGVIIPTTIDSTG
jgi:hypothetical protein